MSAIRLALLTAVVVALAAMVTLWEGAPAERRKVSLDRSVPAVGSPDSLSSTWFCAAGAAGSEPAPRHEVYMTNSAPGAVEVQLSAYTSEGRIGPLPVTVPAHSVKGVDVDEMFAATGLSIMAESSSGSLVVEHALVSDDMADMVSCATSSSSNWYFPSQSTAAGFTVRLFLFNPFSADAGVDISAGIVDGIRSPSQWSGLVVPAGTTRVVDLSAHVQVRDQFSVSVELRSGQIIVETSQTRAISGDEDGPTIHGLSLFPGVSQPRTVWTFAGGFKDAGASEKIIVQNPNRESAAVVVQVVPYGGASMPPEPFKLDVPAGRYSVLDLGAEGRVPDTGFHTIRVESAAGEPVVAARAVSLAPIEDAGTIKLSPGRPDFDQGSSITPGTALFRDRWMIPAVITGEGEDPVALIHNTRDGIARVTVTAYSEGNESVELLSDFEVQSGDGVAVALDAAGLDTKAVRYYEVSSDKPIAVDRLVTFSSAEDFSLGRALPINP